MTVSIGAQGGDLGFLPYKRRVLLQSYRGAGSQVVAMALGPAALFILTLCIKELSIHAADTCPGETLSP